DRMVSAIAVRLLDQSLQIQVSVVVLFAQGYPNDRQAFTEWNSVDFKGNLLPPTTDADLVRRPQLIGEDGSRQAQDPFPGPEQIDFHQADVAPFQLCLLLPVLILTITRELV